MRILHLTYRDSSGVPSRWAAAHRAAGHDATVLAELPHPFRYDDTGQVLRWTPGTSSPEERADRIAEYLEPADVVMAYDHPFYLDAAVASGKPVLYRALGGSARAEADEIRRLLAAPNVVRATAGLAELAALLDVDLVGAPYPLPEPAEPCGELVLCHAPTDRGEKQTDKIIAAADATGWRVDLVEDATNRQVLNRKRTADLVVDSAAGAIPDGYGVNSIEAMALGLPAVAGATRAVRERMAAAGAPVVLVDTDRELRRALLDLRNPAVRTTLGKHGRRFVRRFHNGAERAAEDTAAVQGARLAA